MMMIIIINMEMISIKKIMMTLRFRRMMVLMMMMT